MTNSSWQSESRRRSSQVGSQFHYAVYSGTSAPAKMANISAMLIDLSSESDSESEFVFETVCYTALMKKRLSHGEFALTKEFDDEKFTNYFRLNRDQFKEVHVLVKNEIDREGCNATRPIGTE